MARLLNWIKLNKIASVIIVILAFFLLGKNLGTSIRPKTYEFDQVQMGRDVGFSPPLMGAVGKMDNRAMTESFSAAPTGNDARMVMQESTMSLLVKNVQETKEQILQKTREWGGFMVNTSVNNPQEAATGTVVIRVPAKNLETALQAFRGMAVKVVSENLQGEDVTDQFTDLQAQMATLVKTKAKFDEILDKATKIEDILSVQREIISLQMQIDSLKGQEQYIERNTEMARLTIYLSTDELALPYAPSDTWRPEVIFKHAVRSLVGSFRNVGTLLIWLAVYSIIWVPVLGIIYFVKRRKSPTASRM